MPTRGESLAVASDDPSGLKHWLKATPQLSRPLAPPAIFHPLHTGLPLGMAALMGLLQVRNPFQGTSKGPGGSENQGQFPKRIHGGFDKSDGIP